MSAYAEWKHGIITEDQYRMVCSMEFAGEEDYSDNYNKSEYEVDRSGLTYRNISDRYHFNKEKK